MIQTIEYSYPTLIIEDIVRNHLRVRPDDGELYDNALRCVENAIDVAADYTNRVICPSTVVMEFDAEASTIISMLTAPIRSVKHLYINGEEVADFGVVSNAKSAYLSISATPSGSTMAVRVEAEVGYEGALPGAIYQAVAITATSFFEESGRGELPASVKALLNPYRIYPYGV